MSLSNNFPTIRPSLNLDFANVKALDPRITFTRTTTATYYDGKTTAKAEENLLTYSQEFDNAAWGKINTTATANTEVAPDGTTTAETITDNATSGSHRLRQLRTFIASTNYGVSAFLKKGTSDYGFIALQNDSNSQNYIAVVADLNAGTINAFNGTSATVVSSSITSVGNGWYRVSLVGSVANVSGDIGVNIGISDSANPTPSVFGSIVYVGTGTTIYAWGAQVEQRSAVSAYTPTTTQPITNYIPVLQTAASGVARFDHNPTTGESLGLLVEEQRTNLCLQSEDFSTTWGTSNGTDVVNTIVAPSGALTGDLFQENTANGVHGWDQAITTVASTTYTFSVYAKYAGRYLRLALNRGADTALWAAATYDLSLGTVLGTNAAGGGTVTSTSITAVGNGWYRCVLTGDIGANTDMRVLVTPALNVGVYTPAGRGRESYTGDGYSGIYVWGAQLEAGAFPTSYIATTSASVTRTPDVASMTGTNFSSWYRADEGTVFAESQRAFGVSTVGHIFGTSNGTTSERNRIFYNSSTEIRNSSINGGTQNVLIAVSVTAGISIKLCAAYKVNDYYLVANNGTPNTDTNATLPTGQSIAFIGANTGSADGFTNGHIRKIAYYPSRLSDAQLQALTT